MRAKTRSALKTAGIVLLAILLVLIALYIAVPVKAMADFYADLDEQKERISSLKENPPAPIDEQAIAGFDLSRASEIKFNEIQFIISHNSYKKNISDLNYILLSPFTGVKPSRYEHDFILNQLNDGARGVELDIQYVNKRFLVFHIAVKDSRTHCPSWELAVEELKIWSDANPNHLPICVLVEIKAENLPIEVYKRLDQTIESVFGRDKLITPSLLMGENETLRSVADKNDWVTLDKVLGKAMFILHPCDGTDKYIEADPTMRSQVMVPMFAAAELQSENPKHSDYYLLLKNDDPDPEKIQPLVNSGFMVRTRMDEPLIYSEERKRQAIASGAQIISADYQKGVVYPKVGYISELAEGKTVILRRP